MKKTLYFSINGSYDFRDSKYYESLIADGKSLLGEGLCVNVVARVVDMDYWQLLKLLRHIESLESLKAFDNK